MLPRWFLLLNGVALCVMGGMLCYARLTEETAWGSPRRFFGLLWGLLCCAVGVGLVLMGNGWLRQPGSGERRVVVPVETRMGTKPAPDFPVDR